MILWANENEVQWQQITEYWCTLIQWQTIKSQSGFDQLHIVTRYGQMTWLIGFSRIWWLCSQIMKHKNLDSLLEDLDFFFEWLLGSTYLIRSHVTQNSLSFSIYIILEGLMFPVIRCLGWWASMTSVFDKKYDQYKVIFIFNLLDAKLLTFNLTSYEIKMMLSI